MFTYWNLEVEYPGICCLTAFKKYSIVWIIELEESFPPNITGFSVFQFWDAPLSDIVYPPCGTPRLLVMLSPTLCLTAAKVLARGSLRRLSTCVANKILNVAGTTDGETQVALFAASKVHAQSLILIFTISVDGCVHYFGRPFFFYSTLDKYIASFYICPLSSGVSYE